MKKALIALASIVLFASIVNADIARLEMGGGAWDQTEEGTLSYTNGASSDTYIKGEQNLYAWMLIKHPILPLPNLRLEYTTLKDTGILEGIIEDFNVPSGIDATNSLDITQYDIIPYYNLLDNTAWITLDVGVDLKVMKNTYKVNGVTKDTTSIVIPMGYVRARIEIPVTNIGLEADVKYISSQGNTVADIRVKVDYTLGFIPVIQPALEVGYRVQKFDITSDDENTKLNIEFSGLYAGLILRF
ncbi:MAG: hypothetical protein DSZ04_01515 [Sulfurimonas sp.]|nr:MAG: hypothetical protein DSZ04_01515 [Sulfurimonas sp.]